MRLASLLGVLLCAHAAAQPSDDAEIASWVARLDEAPDPLHADYTPAVHALCALGLRGASAILAPLDAADEMTRLEGAAGPGLRGQPSFRLRPGSVRRQPRGDAEQRALWHENGAYDFRVPTARRASPPSRAGVPGSDSTPAAPPRCPTR
ncbi:MAG: hypothetical protein KF901_11235 [Myxococcales bacterium]|nr:hypothetical protein [Myxococcales bacterium]